MPGLLICAGKGTLPGMAARKRNEKAFAQMSWHERIKKLHPKRQELVRPALQNPRNFLLLSIRALAKMLDTDTATIQRIVRGMEFSGYPEFQRYLQELAIANATSLDTMLSARTTGARIPAHMHESLEQDLTNLTRLRNSLDAQRLASVAKRVWNAHRIVIIGGDLATCMVDYLDHHLTLLGLPVFSATKAGRVMNVVRFLDRKDLVFAISWHRGLRQTIEGLRYAKSRGAYCVGVTDTFVSPVARFADECFLASVETHHFGASYVAPMALFNFILVACANYRRKHTLALLKEVSQEQQRGFRWYDS